MSVPFFLSLPSSSWSASSSSLLPEELCVVPVLLPSPPCVRGTVSTGGAGCLTNLPSGGFSLAASGHQEAQLTLVLSKWERGGRTKMLC